MKILYGIQGTGNGHLTRSRLLAERLQQQPLEVDYLISGRQHHPLFGMEVFGDYRVCRGLSFATRDGAIDYAATIRLNNVGQFWREIRQLDLSGYDLVISDYEPVVAWAARRQGVPCVGIGHQYAFCHDVPRPGHDLSGALLLKYFAPVDTAIGLHWHHFNQPILPPIIDTRLSPQGPRQEKVLVYLPFEHQQRVIESLLPLKQYQLFIYGPGLSFADQGHIHLRAPNLRGFKQDLCESGAVICNAGFELVSEALHLGIQPLVKPVSGQIEQQANALALEQLCLGDRLTTLDTDCLRDALAPGRLGAPQEYPDVASALAQWISKGYWYDTQSLLNDLWPDPQPAAMQQQGSSQAA
ncbi:glycosyltransferase [Aestuariirhabdus sp. Z084]|uniref:MJ1255/VC2487 family glycosyltransferase n=1 Tax=Aestuariirhabdus haliotis TaxID=2918751 RepID=UPI00201B3677|nr:MJ1255/VC2487 family glycosyltransferase [Aestuariirhabdus haliotis]MCL6415710.1 glycosyltransferase [Aestuariirhabdus haliotis]MCL6419764.1 glycosyltransferase [Aestuariirhabdus haliotis]